MKDCTSLASLLLYDWLQTCAYCSVIDTVSHGVHTPIDVENMACCDRLILLKTQHSQ